MKSVEFKTNIKCGGCVAVVTPYLNKAVGEGRWQVNTQSPDKRLTAETEDATAVRLAVEQAGYKAERL
ncbi:heavy metal transport/detoxification protein [Spirosoma taeanense]|uniref:Heavy metal transport/detoxification protein n=1 Tax=Spirosoma taeanense TaxID=2735870 RepID=A0A6M5YB13_9BACT|nr:heavy metal transport/detoxification protein [Spirosoma taeanense]QJW90470.1 heavy metal transport/detoxification protein [Spirosoma taeanense]